MKLNYSKLNMRLKKSLAVFMAFCISSTWVPITAFAAEEDRNIRIAEVSKPDNTEGTNPGIDNDDGTFTYWGVMPGIDKPSKSELYYIDYADENTRAGIYAQFVPEPLPSYEIILRAESSESIEYQGDTDGELSVKNYTDEGSADWFSNAVTYAVENNLFSGSDTTAFSSKTDMSRAMFVTMLGRMSENAGLSTSGYLGGLSDGDSGAWYADYV